MILSKFLIHTKMNNNEDTTWGNHWLISGNVWGDVVLSQLDISNCEHTTSFVLSSPILEYIFVIVYSFTQ